MKIQPSLRSMLSKSYSDSIILTTESSTGLIHKIKITEYFYSTKVPSV